MHLPLHALDIGGDLVDRRGGLGHVGRQVLSQLTQCSGRAFDIIDHLLQGRYELVKTARDRTDLVDTGHQETLRKITRSFGDLGEGGADGAEGSRKTSAQRDDQNAEQRDGHDRNRRQRNQQPAKAHDVGVAQCRDFARDVIDIIARTDDPPEGLIQQ